MPGLSDAPQAELNQLNGFKQQISGEGFFA